MKRAHENKQVFITSKRNEEEKCKAIISNNKCKKSIYKTNAMQKETTAPYATHGPLTLILH